MRRLLLVLAAGLLAYATVYCWRMHDAVAHQTDRDGLLWLRAEYKLGDQQFASVKALHEAYQVTCDDMCRRENESAANVARLIAASKSVTPEVRAALQDHERLQAECQAATLAHAYETATVMEPGQAARYLQFITGCMMQGQGGTCGMMGGKH